MICFRSLNYFWLIPTAKPELIRSCVLWFAFVLWTTFDWYQRRKLNIIDMISCDLLSFFELLLIDTNSKTAAYPILSVVICFRSLNYFWLIPTQRTLQAFPTVLWFAFVLWTTFDWYQLTCWNWKPDLSCDLLSFFELLLIDTNAGCLSRSQSLLWFAFVLWTTFDWYQPDGWLSKTCFSCDLLSFFELLLIDTNQGIQR